MKAKELVAFLQEQDQEKEINIILSNQTLRDAHLDVYGRGAAGIYKSIAFCTSNDGFITLGTTLEDIYCF